MSVPKEVGMIRAGAVSKRDNALPLQILSIIFNQRENCVSVNDFISSLDAPAEDIEVVIEILLSLGVIIETGVQSYSFSEIMQNTFLPRRSHTNTISNFSPDYRLNTTYAQSLEDIYSLPLFQNRVAIILSVPDDVNIQYYRVGEYGNRYHLTLGYTE